MVALLDQGHVCFRELAKLLCDVVQTQSLPLSKMYHSKSVPTQLHATRKLHAYPILRYSASNM